MRIGERTVRAGIGEAAGKTGSGEKPVEMAARAVYLRQGKPAAPSIAPNCSPQELFLGAGSQPTHPEGPQTGGQVPRKAETQTLPQLLFQYRKEALTEYRPQKATTTQEDSCPQYKAVPGIRVVLQASEVYGELGMRQMERDINHEHDNRVWQFLHRSKQAQFLLIIGISLQFIHSPSVSFHPMISSSHRVCLCNRYVDCFNNHSPRQCVPGVVRRWRYR